MYKDLRGFPTKTWRTIKPKCPPMHKNIRMYQCVSMYQSSGISNKRKRSGWENVYEAVNAVGSEKRTQAEVKKKWSNIKVDVKRRMAAPRQSVAKTGGGTGEEGPILFKQRALWVTLLSQGWWEHMWVTLITPQGKYLCICVTHNKPVHTVT